MKHISLVLCCLIFGIAAIWAQGRQTFKLAPLYQKGRLTVVSRQATVAKDSTGTFLRMAEGGGEGLVWLPINHFGQGRLELALRGKDVLQKSFVGIAFHGANDSTYDAVYCRPFNFFAQDSVRRIHAIQYISHPVYTWRKLREERNAVFEKAIASPPDPNGWFILTLMVTDKKVEAYINHAAKPALVVNRLGNRTKGKLGLFMGDGSGGDFTSFSILPFKQK
jgi:hypothetical protein